MAQLQTPIRVETPDTESENRVRKIAVLAMVGTLVFACAMSTYVELSTRSGLLAMSNLPMTVLLPFVFWLLGNSVLKRFWPQLSLSATEMRVLFCLLWVGGLFAGFNWATQWAGMMASPRYFASPENRWEELYFDDLPNWMLPLDTPGVVDGFYQGIWSGVPWGAWLGPIFWAGSIALAITAVGLGLTALFQKQWAQHERLVYPLAEVSLELTEGFDRKPGWPAFMQNKAFWAGFFIAALPLLWNIGEYFIPDFPRIAIFDPMFGRTGRRGAPLSRYLPPFAFSYRILPTLMGFTFSVRFEHSVQHLVGLPRGTGGTIRHESRGVHSGAERAGSRCGRHCEPFFERGDVGTNSLGDMGSTRASETRLETGSQSSCRKSVRDNDSVSSRNFSGACERIDIYGILALSVGKQPINTDIVDGGILDWPFLYR